MAACEFFAIVAESYIRSTMHNNASSMIYNTCVCTIDYVCTIVTYNQLATKYTIELKESVTASLLPPPVQETSAFGGFSWICDRGRTSLKT